MVKRLGFEPGGPAQLAGFAQLNTRDFLAGQHQLGVPGEFLAGVEPDPVAQPLETRTGGKEPFEVRKFHRTEAQAHMHLAIPNAGAHDHTRSQATGFAGVAQFANRAGRQAQPPADKGLHFGANRKEILDDGLQALSIAVLLHQSGTLSLSARLSSPSPMRLPTN